MNLTSPPQSNADGRGRAPSAFLDQKQGAAVHSVHIAAGLTVLSGDLTIPADATGVVLFAHGSGSGRHSPRNQFVARAIQGSGLATLLFDLLSPEEEREDSVDGHLRFDIGLLARRLMQATSWIRQFPDTRYLGIGYFGASTGGGAALLAAAEMGMVIQAVVSRGGRPDLVGKALSRVNSPTLLIVGERDEAVLQLNWDAYYHLHCEKRLERVTGATHLFEEPGALEKVAAVAADWFRRYLRPHECPISQSHGGR